MQKMEAGVTTYFEWLAQNLKAGDKIGVDPSQISAGKTTKLLLKIWYSCIPQ